MQAVANDAYAWTFAAFLTLLDVERVEDYARESHAITAAVRVHWAFASPKKLEGEGQALEARMRADQDPAPEATSAKEREAIDLLARVVKRPEYQARKARRARRGG
jgi:hypothetical protein